MKITVKERLNYLRERNLNIFRYDVTDIDEEALLKLGRKTRDFSRGI